MAARLGNVLYWFSNAIALVLLVSAVGMWRTGHYTTHFETGVIGVVVWLFGRACRYVLAGK